VDRGGKGSLVKSVLSQIHAIVACGWQVRHQELVKRMSIPRDISRPRVCALGEDMIEVAVSEEIPSTIISLGSV
jgi:hypothetical protein